MTAAPRRSLLQLTVIALQITAIWLAVAIFYTSEFYRRSLATFTEPVLQAIFHYQVGVALYWAVLTPVVVFIAERLPFRGPHRWRNVLILAAIVPLIALIRSAWGGIVLPLLDGEPITQGFIWYSVKVRFFRNAFLTLVIIGLSHLIGVYRDAAARERRAFEAEAELANAELAHLRARLQPRFMFATLQSIAERIVTNPREADRLLVSVSALLRRSLDFDRRGTIALHEELEFVDSYLSIEKTRLGENAPRTRIDADEQLLGALVPALLLQTLVESAIANGGERAELELYAAREGEFLRIDVGTNGSADVGETTLSDVRTRLHTLFGPRHRVIVRRKVGMDTVISLLIPLQFPSEAAA